MFPGFLEFIAKSWPFGPLVLSLVALPRRLQLYLRVYATKIVMGVEEMDLLMCSPGEMDITEINGMSGATLPRVGRQGCTHQREKHTFKLCPDWTAIHKKINVRGEAREVLFASWPAQEAIDKGQADPKGDRGG